MVKKPVKSKKKSAEASESLITILKRNINSPFFGFFYMAISVVTLLVTSYYWALLSARLEQGNADQLVDTYLFKNSATFHGAIFPSDHTMLLKWPIFILTKLFGSTPDAIISFTIILVLLTLIGLVIIIYKIEHRPIIFGTLCLALASVLILVPPQPYAGGLLPVNMAMLTTRNIEYIFYIASITLIIRSARLKSWGMWIGISLLSILIASDKLFLIISLGGAGIALVIYALFKAWGWVSLFVNWLVAGLVAFLLATIILFFISSSHITHLNGGSAIGPYSLNSGSKGFVIGGIYALMGILTNFGANPAFSSVIVKNIPSQFINHLFSLVGIAYLINIILILFGIYITYNLLKVSLILRPKSNKPKFTKASILTLFLIWSSIAGVISFIVTSHYYAVDARYLTICFFTIFIAGATYTRTKKWRSELVVLVGLIIGVGIVVGITNINRIYYSPDNNALANTNGRNQKIAQILKLHKVNVLIGDYWRVIPTKLDSANQLNVLPLQSCNTARQVLSSSYWQPNLNSSSFAYLISFDSGLTNYTNCSLDQVLNFYGHPNASTLVSGTLLKPTELLLFYDRGINKPPATQAAHPVTTVLPITLANLPNTGCSGPTVVNIVAHEDDDLLFMSPDLIKDIDAGYCVRTIYVTAGNAGENSNYWISREEGSEAAYSYMLNSTAVWTQRTVELNNHEFITEANPHKNSNISLIFMMLPDGNLEGQGFSSSDYQSVAKLKSGTIKVINTVDGQSYYSASDLVNALTSLLITYRATAIHTQSTYPGTRFPDHSDHNTTGYFATLAYKQYESEQYANQVTIPITYYLGYPVHELTPNLSGSLLTEKENAFINYVKYDGHVCQTLSSCLATPTYSAYIRSEYTYSD